MCMCGVCVFVRKKGAKTRNTRHIQSQQKLHTHRTDWYEMEKKEGREREKKKRSYYTVTHTINSVVIYQFNIYICRTLTSNT